MIDTHVFCNREALLSPEAWQRAVAKAGFDLQLPPAFDSAPEVPIFVPCQFERLESGFDLCVSELAPSEWSFSAEEAERVSGFNTAVTFTTYSNAQEIAGAVTALASFAAAVNGVVADEFFEQRLVEPSEAVDWANRRLPNARSQFKGPSKLRPSLQNGLV